jgi:hypothetical protein
MQSNSESLYQAVFDDLLPDVSTAADYFGLGNQIKPISEKDLSYLLGLYQGILKIIYAKKKKDEIICMLENAFQSNSLDKFIDNAYEYFRSIGGKPESSAYYRWYKSTNYKIGSTYAK